MGSQVLSALGMGCMRFESPQKIDQMAEVVYRAFERGITYFDTAPGYCEDKSEIILGTAVKQMKKSGKPFLVSTKSMAANPTDVRAQCEKSIERLNVDAIDFYHVWCLVHPEEFATRKRNGAIDEFRRLKDEGLIKHICVSTHLEHGKVGAMLDEADGLFEGMLIGLNAANYDLRYPGVHEAAKRGIAVVTMNTLGGGLIANHADHFQPIMNEGDQSVVEAAIRFNLSLPDVTVALVGFRNINDVDSAVDAAERFKPLSTEEIDATWKRLVQSKHDFCTQCGYCRDCPVEIPVVRLMETYNHRMLDGPRAGLDRLKWHWQIEDVRKVVEQCTQCRQCEEACTQHLPILERFEQMCKDQEQA